MKAAVLHEVNKPLVIEDVSLPKPGPREVLIRTSVAVLCHDTSVKMLPGASNRLSWARPEKLNQFLNLSSFAEQMLVHENAIVKIRRDMPLELAAVIGCGVIAMAAINGAQIAGAGRIIAVDTNPAKLQLATKLGATDIVDPQNGDVVQQV